MERTEFLSDGTTCVGHWFWPPSAGPEPLPVIVMGHGFSAEWTFGTAETIADFTAAGFAVFTFDYRHYGESAGQPRQLLYVGRELNDWRSALNLVRADQRIDPHRLCLWGSSLGGGHALTIASEDHGIVAAAAQVPHCSAMAAVQAVPLGAAVRTTAHALWDAMVCLFGGNHTIPILGDPGDVGGMTYPGWKEEVLRLKPTDSDWVNALPARSMLSIVRYSPGHRAAQIRCPVCIHYGLNDRGVPPASVEKTARKIPQVELHPFEGDHFDVYHGQVRADTVSDQIGFFARALKYSG